MLDIRRLTAVGLNVRPSHVLKLADALSDAIETVMNNLSQPARLLKEDVDIFEWPLQVEYEGDSPHHVTIRVVKDSGKWKISRELMESVLSLWVSSTRERHEAARSNIRDHPNDFGLRLLGKTSSKLQRDLGWWMPRHEGDILHVQFDAANGPHSIARYQVVGGVEVPSASISSDNMRFDKVGLQSDPYGTTDSSEQEKDDFLATECNVPLAQLYALDLFASFMWTLAPQLHTRVAGGVDLGTKNTVRWPPASFENQKLSDIVRHIHETGLGSMHDILASIIPPLSSNDRLPGLDQVIELAREHAEKFEMSGKLQGASVIYLEVYQAMDRSSENTPEKAKATAILAMHLEDIESMIRFEEELCISPSYGSKEILATRKTLTNELSRSYLAEPIKAFRNYKASVLAYWTSPESNADLEKHKGALEGYREKFQWNSLHETGINPVSIENETGIDPASLENLQLLRDGDKSGIDTGDLFGWTPLHYAVLQPSNIFVVNLLLEWGASPDTADLRGWTPLHYACLTQDGPCIESLLSFSHRRVRGRDGSEPIHCTAKSGGVCIDRLVKLGNTANDTDSYDMSPWMWSVVKGDEEALINLLYYADPLQRDTRGRTALHLAALSTREGRIEFLSEHVFTDQETRSMMGESRDKKAKTPLDLAVMKDTAAAIKPLFSLFEANADAQKPSNSTPLHLAVQSKSLNALQELLRHAKRVSPSVRNSQQRTPLHEAAMLDYLAGVRALLKAGAEVHAKDNKGKTPLDLAREADASVAVVDLLSPS
jgi:ankyrin repeat protein